MLSLPPVLLLSLLPLLSSSSFAEAAALPAKGKGSSKWCSPRFSGLVQEIRKSGQGDVVWKAVPNKPGPGAAMDGVKAVSLGKSRSAALELEYEWFVENTQLDGVYAVVSGASPSTCLSSSLTPHHNPLEPDQHAFAPSALLASSCAPSHSFRIVCQSCDAHEDSASSCLVQSLSKGLCVELLPPTQGGEREGRPHLGWSECAWEDKGMKAWKGREERDARRQRQLWDITPS
ncbi:hypothetical protein JCM11251_001965 [Rhodosporidiobolus azoricus]